VIIFPDLNPHIAGECLTVSSPELGIQKTGHGQCYPVVIGRSTCHGKELTAIVFTAVFRDFLLGKIGFNIHILLMRLQHGENPY
jgi:hypothetical protein